MKALVFILALLSGTGSLSQDKNPPILEITIDGWGVVWPQGKHNYLTVWPDGTVTYLHKAKRGLTSQITDAISHAALEELRQLFQEVSKPSPSSQPTVPGPLDYRLTVHIQIVQAQPIEIGHFDFDRPDAIPKPVYNLLCVADFIRDEPYRLTKSSNCDSVPQPQGLQPGNSHDVVTLCQIPVPHDLQDAGFTLVYTFETTERGELTHITKVMNDFLPDQPFISCMSAWKLPSLSGKGVAEFFRTPTEGWTEIHVSGKGFDQSFPYHQPSKK